MKRTKRNYDFPRLYTALKMIEPTVRLWVPTLFRSEIVYGFRILSSWDRMLLRISAKERREYNETLMKLAEGNFEGLDPEWLMVESERRRS